MALAIDSQESGGTAHRGDVSGTPITWSFNNAAGNLIVIGVTVTNGSGAGAPSISAGPTYNSVALTAGPSATCASATSLTQLFYLASPAVGSNTVSVTGTGGSSYAILAWAISFSGADTSTPFGTTSTGTS